MWEQIKWCWVCIHLFLLAAEDAETGFLSMHVIGSLGISGAIAAGMPVRPTAWLPGMALLVIGYLSDERIGYGDGYLALALGFWMNVRELAEMLGGGILAAVCVSAVTGKKELPLTPFLAAVYVLRGWN